MIIQNWLLRKVSVNYIALVIGIVMGLLPQINASIFMAKPEIFMGMIVAPLLFFEGQRNRLYNIARSWKSIVSITVFMIIIATMVAAFSIKWLIGLALPLSFILAAISTPTDATATESVTHGLKMPKKVSSYLQHESLFNDASGIILLEMALTWYLSKKLEIPHTLASFLYSAGGGIILGLVIASILVLIRQKLVRVNLHFVNNSFDPVNAIITITPFLLYYFAESIHVSGIIAVVVAGLVHRAELERSRLTNVYSIYNSLQLSSFVSDLLNIIVFIGLRLTIVRTSENALLPNRIDLAIWIGVILYIANVLVRYLYSLIFVKLTNKEAWIFALGGIHGAVTFALAELEKIYMPKKIRKQVCFDLKAQINETSMRDFLHELKKSIKQPEMPADEIYRYAFRLELNYLGQIVQ